MSATQALGRPSAPAMSIFERWLTLWVALCIIVGIALGQIFPAPFHALGNLTVAQVNLPIAALVWLPSSSAGCSGRGSPQAKWTATSPG